MKIKDKLSLQFTFMFAVLLFMVLAGTYLYVQHNRVNTFYSRLDDRAVTAAQFYLGEDNISKEKFKKILKKFPQTLFKEAIRIYNDSLQPRFIAEDTLHWSHATLKQVIAKKELHFSEGRNQVTGIYYVDNSGNYIIMVSAEDGNGQHFLHDLGLIMTCFFLASLLVTFLTGRIFARYALHPIVGITNNLKRIRASSLDLRLPVNKKNSDEIDTISSSINQLLEHLEQSFDNQKSFVANASHELRTPITTILGEAEITLMNERSATEYQSVLGNIIKEAERLHYIINSLMELIQTSIENQDFENISINELFWEIKDELHFRNPEHDIDIQLNMPDNDAKSCIPGNRQLLSIAINNILKNAIKFSENKPVKCNVSYTDRGLHISISDQGIGIEQKDLSKIFQPFFRSTNAISYPGYGIGLALTYNIIRLHNGTITVNSQLNSGTEFQIYLPK